MTLQSSGTIKIADIAAEFGGSPGHSLSEYYRGGTYVPSGASVSIPTSGSISLSDFYGASNEGIGASWVAGTDSLTRSKSQQTGAPYIRMVFRNDGTWDEVTDNSSNTYDWNLATPPGATYYIKWDKISGTLAVTPSSGFTENVYKAMDSYDDLYMTTSWNTGYVSNTTDIWIAESAAGLNAVKRTYTFGIEYGIL